ncbi:DUF4350 domain-containing protein [Ornithinimicrobium sp. LYQ121]|uniref:DUF4350 domain-containing protein n=1 Tax=Ornithinimicrobium sp. LYQ121 TaxID=3378801 RepID=UPI003853E692
MTTTPSRRRLRRWVPPLLLLLAAAVVALLLSARPPGEPLGPDDPGREGARALVQVLEQQGVDVRVVEGLTALPDTVGPGTTVLLASTAYLGPEGGADLVARTRSADGLVVVAPDAESSPGAALGLDLDVTWGSGQQLTGACDDPRVREGDVLSGWDVVLQADGVDRRSVGACFPPTPGHNAGGARDAAMLTFPATAGRAQTTVLGFGRALTNAEITDDAHAALALRLLGQSPTLLWVVPVPADAGLDASLGLWDVLPRNLTASVVLLGATVLVLALWQGRRLGPVVVEPLPAVVPAAETTRSRGRLYRQARDRDHALAALQAGARHRLAPRLGLPHRTDPQALARAVAAATDRPVTETTRLLTDPAAPDDHALVTTARELRSLEEGLQP